MSKETIEYWKSEVQKHISNAVCKRLDVEYRIYYNDWHIKYFGKGKTEYLAWKDAMRDLNNFSA